MTLAMTLQSNRKRNRRAVCVAALLAVVAAPAGAQSLFSPVPLTSADWASVSTVQLVVPEPAASVPPAAAPAAEARAETKSEAKTETKTEAAAPAPAPVAATPVPPPAPAPAPVAAAPAPATPAPAPLADVSEPPKPEGPALKHDVTVIGELVRIGDLIDNAGAVADVAIFRAPDLGQTGSVPAARVLDAVRPHHLLWVNTRGLDEVLVTRASRTIGAKELEARLLRALAGQTELLDAKSLAASFDSVLRPIQVEPSAELGIARLSYDPRSRRFDATFDLPTGAARRPVLRVTGALVETVEAVVPLRAIAHGEVLKASDVMVERRPKVDALALEDVVGFAAKRPLKVGEVIRTGDVMKPELVARNETVTITFEAPGMLLTIRGQALESGALGDPVNVLNVQSKRTLQATVTGPSRVTVAARTPRLAANGGTEPAEAR
jgi:flagellar basal body P-ring formation protein FlgA